MTYNLHLLTAVLFGLFAWLLWWTALPPLLAKRSRLTAWGPWLLGMAMALYITHKLTLWTIHAAVSWTVTLGDICLMAAAVSILARSHEIGPFRWGKCPGEVERGL